VQGQVFPIVDKPNVGQRWVRVDDFVLGEGRPIDVDVVAKSPCFSLYCIDFEDQTAVFVETAHEDSLRDAVFMFEVQRSAAQRIVKIPLETMHRIASQAAIEPDHIALIYSVGRCGSTMLSKAFGTFDGVASLSEPDVMTQLIWLWGRSGLDKPENEQLLRDCTIMQCLPTKLTGSTHWALKFRSYVTIMGPMYGRCLPEAKSVFLYRSLIPWLRSYIRMLGGGDLHAPFNPEYVSFLGSIVPQLGGRTDVPLLEVALCAWIGSMEAAVEMQRSGQRPFCLRYEELAKEPMESVSAVARFCGFGEPKMDRLAKAIRQDSQEGSTLSRDTLGEIKVNFETADIETISRMLAKHSPLVSEATVLPGTFFP
jgi:hypothetical protein